MPDPVDHALSESKLRKAAPPRPVFITLVHQQSGARKSVQYLGMAGIPLRAQIFWPIAGDYLVSPRSGTLLGPRKSAEALRHWKVSSPDHVFLKNEYRSARARLSDAERLTKCP